MVKNINQRLCYYPFADTLDRCVRNCNALDNLTNKASVPNKPEDLNLSIFNMIKGINESKTLKCIYQTNVNVNLMVKNVT